MRKKNRRRPGFDQALRDFLHAVRKLSRESGAPLRVTMTWEAPARDHRVLPEQKDRP